MGDHMPDSIVGDKPSADSLLRKTLSRLRVLEEEIDAALDIIVAERDPYEDVRSYSLTDLAAITGTPRLIWKVRPFTPTNTSSV